MMVANGYATLHDTHPGRLREGLSGQSPDAINFASPVPMQLQSNGNHPFDFDQNFLSMIRKYLFYWIPCVFQNL